MFSKKKLLVILLLAVLLLSIAGCGGGEKQPEAEVLQGTETADSKYGGTLRFPLDPILRYGCPASSMLETYSLGRLITVLWFDTKLTQQYLNRRCYKQCPI